MYINEKNEQYIKHKYDIYTSSYNTIHKISFHDSIEYWTQ